MGKNTSVFKGRNRAKEKKGYNKHSPGEKSHSPSHCRLEEVFANHVQLCPRLHYPHLFFQDFLWHDPLSLDDKLLGGAPMSSSYFPIPQHRVKKLTHFPGPLVGLRWKITKSE